MAMTLKKRLYNAIKEKADLSSIEELIRQGVDCNLSHFNRDTLTFISPIQLAAENDPDCTLCLLYKHRNSPTITQLEQHVTFYINHHVQSQDKENETLFEYTVSRLLHIRINEHPKKVFHTLIAALHDYDNAELRDESLCDGSTHEILIQLRIYTLFRKTIEMTINSDNNNNMLTAIEEELLHNLEAYYFLDSISRIPVVITKKIMNKKFTEIESSQKLLIKYYQCIAENVIHKIEKLAIDQEYTIPTGWIKHAVCVSFRRISKTHIHIRVDNPSPRNPRNAHETSRFTDNYSRIKPKILGQLALNKLEVNLDYFILLIDSVKRELTSKEGIALIYNLNRKIRDLESEQMEDVPSFVEQAAANCFVKCYEPGFWIRFGRTHPDLCEQLLLCEKNNANELAQRCDQALFCEENPANLLLEHLEEEYLRHINSLYDRFILLAKEDNISSLPVPERKRLQYQLQTSYKEHYRYLSGYKNSEPCSSLRKKYVPLRFENNNTSIELTDIFIKPRVLVLSEAGCGKTTICQYATYLWACKKMWKNKFEWLFYINMRNLNSKLYPSRPNNYSLIDIIEVECFQGYKLNDLDKQKLRNQFENPSNILWILDGCNERTIPDYLCPIERELLDKPQLLLTSRPYLIDELKYDTQIQIQGFNNQDIKNYIEKYFSNIFSATIKKSCSFIGESEHLREAARIPACLEIMCSLWKSGNEISEPGITTGELYQKMCEYLLRHYLLKFHGQRTSYLAERDVYEHPNAIVFTHLEYLAFEATKLNRLTISNDELGKINNSSFLSVLQIGLLKAKTRNPSPILVENTYYFVHQSFQEYLCARYMIRALSSIDSKEQEKEVIRFIIDQKYNRRLQNTFRLFFELKRSISCTNNFWSAVDSEPRDLVGLRHCSRISRWFPHGSCGFLPEDEENINKRTIDAVITWISKKDRRAHHFSNIYLFEWFDRVIDGQYWLTAWKEDLFMKESLERRYFLPDLWSTQNIDALKETYDNIPKNDLSALHCLITKGPMKANLERLHIDPKSFIIHNNIKASEVMIATQKVASERESITTPAEFEVLLQNYASFASLNRQTEALGIETWRLKIAPSALTNINDEMLKLLLQLSTDNALFYHDFDLPVIDFLKLYAEQSALNGEILCSLIVSITFSSKCILTAPPGEKKLIRVHKKDDTFVNIELNQQRWESLIKKFDSTRDEYGYSSFFRHDD